MAVIGLEALHGWKAYGLVDLKKMKLYGLGSYLERRLCTGFGNRSLSAPAERADGSQLDW